MKVEIINQLKDNYSFVLYNDTLKSCVIDPADSNPISALLPEYFKKLLKSKRLSFSNLK